MNKLHIAPDAMEDLIEIRRYITEELANPSAADNLLRKMTKKMRMLMDHAELGKRLSSVIGMETEYRFLVCDHYLIFYRYEQQDVYIIRVLYGRRDYIKILFGK